MRIEDRANGLELADVIVAERSWNERQLVAYTVAHRGLAFDGGEAPERPGTPMHLFPESSSEIYLSARAVT